MNKNFQSKIRKIKNKIEMIKILGGKCQNCGEDNIFKLVFHHIESQEKELKMANYKDSKFKLFDEIKKCKLLCNNCHREFHFNIDNKKDYSRRLGKRIYLNYKGVSCIKCGYDKCQASLTFHHRDPDIKEFSIGSISERINSINDIDKKIKEELDKCDILCANCHTVEHSDIDFYEKNKEIIDNYVVRKISKKVNRLDVEKMFNLGLNNKQISEKLGVAKNTISSITTKLKKK